MSKCRSANISRTSARRCSTRSRPTRSRWAAFRRTPDRNIRRSCRAAWSSAPDSRAPLRSIRSFCSSTSRRPASTRSRRPRSTSLSSSLQKRLDLTVFLITHDLDTLYAICDRVAVLADRKVIAVGTIPELLALDHPWIQEYFNGPRGRAAADTAKEHAAGLMETRSNYVMVGAVTLAMLAGLLLFTVWIAGLSNKQTKCYDIYFAQGVSGLNKGSNVTFSGVPVGQVEPDFAASEPARVRLGADRGRRRNARASGHDGADQGRRLHRRQRNPARRSSEGRSPDHAAGAAGLPGDPGELGRPRRSAQQRSGADRPHPAPDRAPDRAAQRREPECDFRHSRECRTHHRRARRARSGSCRCDGRRADRRAAGRPGRGSRLGACRQHQCTGHRAGASGGRGSSQGDCCGGAGGEQPRCNGRRRASRIAELEQVDPARSQPPDPRHAGAVASAAAACPNGSSRKASAAPWGRRNCPTTSRGSSDENACAWSLRPRWHWPLAAARSAGCSAVEARRRRRF